MKSLISYVVAKTKVINGKYHRFLGRHFPRFYVLYTVFMKGKAKTNPLNPFVGNAKEFRISKITCMFCYVGVSWGVFCFINA